MLGGKAVEKLAVKLGCKARVDERGLDAVLGSQAVCHALAQFKEVAKRKHGYIAALTRDVVAHDAIIGALGGRQIGTAYQADARYADRYGMLTVVERPAQHGQVFFHADRCQVAHVGKSAQHGNIKEREVRLGRCAKDRSAKHQDGCGGVVEAQVVPQFIVGALQKRAVCAKDRLGAGAGERGGKGDGVLFGNAHVDKLLACRGAKLGRKAHDIGRGSRDGDNLRVVRDSGVECLARNIGIGARCGLARVARAKFATGCHIEGPHMMPVLRVALGRLKALALGGGDVQHDGMIDIAQLLQRIDQRLDIVAGVQVAIVEPQRAENVALAGAVAGAQLGQIAIQTTVVFGNGLVVIVDDNDQVAVEIGGIVKALKRQTARKRAVANNSNDVIRVTRQVARVGKTAAQAHRGRGVTHGKQVMLGLVGIGKARGLAITLRIDIGVRAPGQRLVCVGLVRHVEDNFVGGGVKHAVERDRELNDAQVGGNVSADSGGAFEDGVANLVAELRELGAIKSLDVLGRCRLRKQHRCGLLHADRAPALPRPAQLHKTVSHILAFDM